MFINGIDCQYGNSFGSGPYTTWPMGRSDWPSIRVAIFIRALAIKGRGRPLSIPPTAGIISDVQAAACFPPRHLPDASPE